jgi:hypothetical protein
VRSTSRHRDGEEVETVGDRHGQRLRSRTAEHGPLVEFEHAALQAQPARTPPGIDHLAHEQRIARRGLEPRGQPPTRQAPCPALDQHPDLLGGQRAQVQFPSATGPQIPPHRLELLAYRHRPGRTEQQQRRLPGDPTQPPPQSQTRLISPLQIIDDQHHGAP